MFGRLGTRAYPSILIASLGALAAGCYAFDKGQTKEGQSHWLERCSTRADCGGDQICACGVCTVACEDGDICGAGATCEPVEDRAACDSAPSSAPNVCLQACTSDLACAEPALECVDRACVVSESSAGSDAAMSPFASDGLSSPCSDEGAFEPLVPRAGETCYELIAHGGSGETEPLQVLAGESLSQGYYDVPWPAGSVATRFGLQVDQPSLLHHAFLFEAIGGSPGLVEQQVLGTVLGLDAKLIAAWSQGACNVELPPQVGLELVDPGGEKLLLIQWHHLNATGETQPDASRFSICVVPRDARPNVGGMTILGTESLGGLSGMPAGQASTFSGDCLNATESDITLLALSPHMHQIGTRSRVDILSPDDERRSILDEPFAHELNVHYLAPASATVRAGEMLRSSCTYFNDTTQSVAFGQSVFQEMCFVFTFSYPSGALDKPENPSLIGATNTCWGD